MTESSDPLFYGLVLAAGKSSRMGQPKLNLPWKDSTVLGAVLIALTKGGVKHLYVVINPNRKPEVPNTLRGVDVKWIDNFAAETEDMLVSIQTGIQALPSEADYVFICLGDQPTIEASVIQKLRQAAIKENRGLIFPSFKMRRGHPWLVGRQYWQDILNLARNDTIRTFIKQYEHDIYYVNFEGDPPADMDTPEEYQELVRRFG